MTFGATTTARAMPRAEALAPTKAAGLVKAAGLAKAADLAKACTLAKAITSTKTCAPTKARARPILLALTCTLLAACVDAPAAAPPPQPTLPGTVVKYTCNAGRHLSVTYGPGTVTLSGNEMLLAEEGSANRYSWPSDGTHHVWELSGVTGTLSLHDGTTGTETVEASGCNPDGTVG